MSQKKEKNRYMYKIQNNGGIKMKKIITVLCVLTFVLLLTGCQNQAVAEVSKEESNITMKAKILEINENSVLLANTSDSSEKEQYILEKDHLPASYQAKVGDVLSVTYDGNLLRSYPAQFMKVIEVKLVEK